MAGTDLDESGLHVPQVVIEGGDVDAPPLAAPVGAGQSLGTALRDWRRGFRRPSRATRGGAAKSLHPDRADAVRGNAAIDRIMTAP